MRRGLALAVLVLACDDDPEKIQVAPNVEPIAKIDAPNQAGRGDLIPFDGTMSKDNDGIISGYRWEFGDGTATSSLARAFHTYADVGSYTVKLTVTDNRGATDTATHALSILALAQNQPPVARISAPPRADLGVPVVLDASMSYDPDGQLRSWEWSIGGQLAARGQQVSHTFTTAGSHAVVLTVLDDRGAQATASHSIDVGMPLMNRPPVANAGPDRTVAAGTPVMLDGSMSFDSDGTIQSYEWALGDGARAMGVRANHTYNTQAMYRVRLTVTDDKGLMSTDTATITVGQDSYDGNYSMEANPNMQTCLISPATFVATTIRFTTMGTVIGSSTPNPENPGGAPVTMMGTLTGATFSLNGNWQDSQGATHRFSLNGNFRAGGYTGVMTEALSLGAVMLCTLNWNLSGTKLN